MCCSGHHKHSYKLEDIAAQRSESSLWVDMFQACHMRQCNNIVVH